MSAHLLKKNDDRPVVYTVPANKASVTKLWPGFVLYGEPFLYEDEDPCPACIYIAHKKDVIKELSKSLSV